MKKIIIPILLLISQLGFSQRSAIEESPERYYREGVSFFQQKNYLGAIDQLNRYRKEGKRFDLIREADYMIAASLYEQGVEGALEHLKEYLIVHPDTEHRPIICFMIGSIHFEQEDYQRALYWLEQLDLDFLPEEKQEAAAYKQAYAMMQKGDFRSSKALFKRIYRFGKKYSEVSGYYLAYLDYRDKNYSEAYAGFNRLKDHPKYTLDARYYLTQIDYIEGKFPEALSQAKALIPQIKDTQKQQELYRIAGNIAFSRKDMDNSIEWLGRYCKSVEKPHWSDAYKYGVALYTQKRFAEAVNYLGEAIGHEGLLTQSAYSYLGQSYLSLGDKDQARMAFEQVSKMPYDKELREIATYNYAMLIHETGFSGFGESVHLFENFLNDYPQSQYADRVREHLIEVYYTTKNYSEALRSIEKIKNPGIKLLEAKQFILFQLGTQMFTGAYYQEAISYFTQAIDLGNYDAQARSDAYYWRGETYYKLKDYRVAAENYRKFLYTTARRNDQMVQLANYNLGYSFFNLKDYSQALNGFQAYTAIETDKSSSIYADACNRIGDCYFQNRHFEEAEKYYAEASRRSPTSGAYAIYQRASVLGLQKNYKGKIQELDRLIEQHPTSSFVDDALYEKGRTYLLLEQEAAAEKSFVELINRFPKSSMSAKGGIQLGLLYYNAGTMKEAQKAYKRVVANYPGSEEARVALQDLKTIYVELDDVPGYVSYVNSMGSNVKIEINEQDSLTYIAAEKLFMKGDYSAAKNSLERYLQSYPEGAFAIHSSYYLASIAENQKDWERAKELYDVVITSEGSKFREEAQVHRADIAFLQKDFTDALEQYSRLELLAEREDRVRAARLGILRSAVKVENNEKCIEAATKLIGDVKLSPEELAEVQLERGKALLHVGKLAEAESDFRKVSKNMRIVYGAEAKYRLAQSLFDAAKVDEAEQVLLDFISKGTPHQYWLARGFILLSDVYMNKGDNFQAKQYLSSLKNNYKANDDIADMIEERLNKLN